MTPITSGMLSSETDEWATPDSIFNSLNREFHFTLDVCASESNKKCAIYYDKEKNGLSQVWDGTVWMNPPYGRTIGSWLKKAMDYGTKGVAVCLIPARTDTKWWRDYCMNSSEIRLIAGRLKFGNCKNSAPFPSAIIIFGTQKTPRIVMMEEVK